MRYTTNPWNGELFTEIDLNWIWNEETLSQKNRCDLRIDILRQIRTRLMHWTPSTVTSGNTEQINRLVRIVCGYPDLGGWMPLDMPLRGNSRKSLQLSLMLDSIPVSLGHDSSKNPMSIREYFIRRSQQFQSSQKKRHETRRAAMFLRCLFESLREWEGQNDVEGKWGSLDSYESRLVVCMRSLNSSGLGILTYILTHENKRTKTLEEKLVHLKQDLAMEEVCFEFSWFKDWMEAWWPVKREKDSTGLRIIRGASRILETAMSIVRRYVVEEFGVHNLVIDGGGRIVFYIPKSRDLKTIEEDILERLISLKYWKNDEFKTDVLTAFEKEIETDRDGFDSKFREMMTDSLPPYRFAKNDYATEQDSEADNTDLPVERKRIHFNRTKYQMRNCKECSTIEMTADQERAFVRKRDSEYNNGINLCYFHRLLYFVGHHHRLREVYNESLEGIEDNLRAAEYEEKKRQVSSVCIMDGNSIGSKFQKTRVRDPSPEGKRRRSFRFNSIWYNCVGSCMVTENRFSQLGAWVIAGDDLMIGNYGGGDGGINRLLRFLKELRQKLESSTIEMDIISFSAGLAPIDEQKILFCIENAQHAETIAKYISKTSMDPNDLSPKKKCEREFAISNQWAEKYPNILGRGFVVVNSDDIQSKESIATNFSSGDKIIRMENRERILWANFLP